ncbi:MAG: biosynthetic-type acetolactate synthase large subunit, partial [bacterium]|nr:biosynthetic-type acetolactate synthase large subunit [bacterium]
NYLVKDVNELARIIKEAFYIARIGRPGPVLIDIPRDVQFATTDFDYSSIEINIRGYKPSVTGHIRQIKEAAKLINEAKKPCILAGGGVITAGASEELFRLATKANIPVATTFMGIGSFPQDHPLSLKSAGMHGNYAANYALMECDLLIAIGCRFSDRTTGRVDKFASKAKKIHIDIDPAEINKNVVVDVPIVGDAKIILKTLIEYVQDKKEEEWLRYIIELKNNHPLTYADGPTIKPQFVIEKVCEIVPDNTIIVTEVGQNQMWSALFFTHKKPRHFISSGGLGTMGFGFPASIGAKVGRPDALVVDIAGDGSFLMNIQELATAVENDIPVKIVVINNRALGMVRQWQEIFYKKRYSSTILKEVNFAEIAKAFGAKGIRVTEKEELVPALHSAFEYPGPAVVDVIVEQEENVIPMVPPGAPIDQIIGGK